MQRIGNPFHCIDRTVAEASVDVLYEQEMARILTRNQEAGVAEWSKAAVLSALHLNTVFERSQGSNPCPSKLFCLFILFTYLYR